MAGAEANMKLYTIADNSSMAYRVKFFGPFAAQPIVNKANKVGTAFCVESAPFAKRLQQRGLDSRLPAVSRLGPHPSSTAPFSWSVFRLGRKGQHRPKSPRPRTARLSSRLDRTRTQRLTAHLRKSRPHEDAEMQMSQASSHTSLRTRSVIPLLLDRAPKSGHD